MFSADGGCDLASNNQKCTEKVLRIFAYTNRERILGTTGRQSICIILLIYICSCLIYGRENNENEI